MVTLEAHVGVGLIKMRMYHPPVILEAFTKLYGLTSLSMIISKSIHVADSGIISFFFMAE